MAIRSCSSFWMSRFGNRFQHEALAVANALGGAAASFSVASVAPLRPLPASLPRIHPAHPDGEASSRNRF